MNAREESNLRKLFLLVLYTGALKASSGLNAMGRCLVSDAATSRWSASTLQIAAAAASRILSTNPPVSSLVLETNT